MITFIKRKFRALIALMALMFATVSYAQDNGYGAAGVFFLFNETPQGFQLNESSWADGYFGRQLDGMYFGLPTSLVFTHARARAWSHAWAPENNHTAKCRHLSGAYRIFYRLSIGGRYTDWTSFSLASCVHLGGNDVNLFTVHGAVDIDLLAEAYAFGGEGVFTLQMAMAWRFEEDTPPDSLIQTATFRVMHGEVVEPTIAIAKSNFELPIHHPSSFRISGSNTDSVAIYHNNVLFRVLRFTGATFSETIQFTPREMGDNWITAVAMNRFGFRIVADVDFVVTEGSNRRDVTEDIRYLQVFPNPATTYLIVQTSDVEVGTEILIYNILGRLVGTFQTTGDSTVIDISEFSAGLHILRVGDVIVRWIKK